MFSNYSVNNEWFVLQSAKWHLMSRVHVYCIYFGSIMDSSLLRYHVHIHHFAVYVCSSPSFTASYLKVHFLGNQGVFNTLGWTLSCVLLVNLLVLLEFFSGRVEIIAYRGLRNLQDSSCSNDKVPGDWRSSSACNAYLLCATCDSGRTFSGWGYPCSASWIRVL